MSVAELSQEEVVRRLERYDIVKNPQLARLFPPGQYPHTRRCAILVPLFFHPSDGQLHVLLTQRASTLRSHAQNVAFPGGAQDATDADDTHTALREAHEEIGLEPSDVTIVAHLPPSFVMKNNSVFLVVGFIPSDFRPRPNPHEVAKVFSVPLRIFTGEQVTFTTFEFWGRQVRYPSVTVEVGQERTPVLVWGFTCTGCVLIARAVLGPHKRLRMFADRENETLDHDRIQKEPEEARRRATQKSVEFDDEDDHNVFGDIVEFYHLICKASRPNVRL